MATFRVIYDETERQMKHVNWWGDLKTSAARRVMSGPFRYCLHGRTLFVPDDASVLTKQHRLCWGSIRGEALSDHPWLMNFDQEVPQNPLDLDGLFTGIGFGVRYFRRYRETQEGRTPVSTFIAQSVLDAIDDDPEIMLTLSKRSFEELVAELFARMGFEVDLLRSSKDDGIDFLAVRNDDTPEPIVMAVQTKHPDQREGSRNRTTMSVTTVREIYGVAKAWNLAGAAAITSGRYSREAKSFADRKPHEITVASGDDLLRWIRRYRWNHNE